MKKQVAIVGTGLIGGSLALRLRELNMAEKIVGVESNPLHAGKAMELGLVDEITTLEQAVDRSEIMIIAIPVDTMIDLIPKILDRIVNQVVIDLGSTKEKLLEKVENHPRRRRFVAAHPMWGTEFSGPAAATSDSFANTAAIICDPEDSDKDALDWTMNMFKAIGMHTLTMNAADHDLHAAYVSHISHITSFALANTVLEKEKEEDAIFEMASAGFASTVRLAKSNPDMWVPIFMQNRENILDVLNEHISQLKKFKSCLEKENVEWLRELIMRANGIRKILK